MIALPQQRPEPALSVTFSELRGCDGSPVTKRFWPDESGELHSAVAAQMHHAISRKIAVNSLEELRDYFGAIAVCAFRDRAISFGVTHADEVEIVSKKMLPDHPGCATRTRNFFAFRQLAPGIWLVDYDPPGAATPLTPEELVIALRTAAPWLNCRLLVTHSASSWIYESGKDVWHREQRGLHVYAFVSDASAIPQLNEAMFQATARAGHLHAFITRAGSILPRSLTDRTVGQPERLDFCGYADVAEGLEQRKPEGLIFPGVPVLDTVEALRAAEVRLYDEWKRDDPQWQAVKEAARPDAERVHKAWKAERIKDGKLTEAAITKAFEDRILPREWPITLDDGLTVTVGQILDNRGLYDGRRCDDPLGAYREGHSDAVIYSLDKQPSIFSFVESVQFWLGGAGKAVEATPLYIEPAKPKLYPMGALGPLEVPARAAARMVQVPEAMAAACVLTSAALATQFYADVKISASGKTRPLSLFFLTEAASGDRKSHTDEAINSAVLHLQERLAEEHAEEMEHFMNKMGLYENARTAITKKYKGGDPLQAQADLDALDKPKPPLTPVFVVSSPTIEGLFLALANNVPCIALIANEAGVFLGGHAMSQDKRLQGLSALSACWDGAPIERIRVTDPRPTLYGRRFSMHLMAPEIVMDTLRGDPMAQGQGILSRCLTARPESLQGSRPIQRPDPVDVAAVNAFSELVAKYLEGVASAKKADAQSAQSKKVADMLGIVQEGQPGRAVLCFSPEADAAWDAFAWEIERELPGRYKNLNGLGAKIGEHAARIAGVLTIIANKDAREISGETMVRAIEIARWYLEEAVRLQGAAPVAVELHHAERLFRKLEVRYPAPASFGVREAMRVYDSPSNATATSSARLLRVLEKHGYALEKDGRWQLTGAALIRAVRDESGC